MLRFIRDRWFLILLLLILALGMWQAARLEFLTEHKTVRDMVTATVLFLMALPLEPRTIWKSIRRPQASLLALGVTYGVLPLVAWPASFLLRGELGPGLLVAATTPCTLASTAVWTRRAGGNDTIATMVTILTNLLCFILMPLWLAAMMGHGIQSEEFRFSKAVVQLGMLVVLPMVASQIVRLYRPIADWSLRHKVALSTICQCGILYMVLGGAVQTGFTLFGANARPPAIWELLAMIGVVLAVHLSMLWFGLQLGRICGLSRPDQIAVGFSGSQKTLMIGLKVAMDLGASVLPMVAFHVGQLLVDTVIADRMRRNDEQRALDAERLAASEPRPNAPS